MASEAYGYWQARYNDLRAKNLCITCGEPAVRKPASRVKHGDKHATHYRYCAKHLNADRRRRREGTQIRLQRQLADLMGAQLLPASNVERSIIEQQEFAPSGAGWFSIESVEDLGDDAYDIRFHCGCSCVRGAKGSIMIGKLNAECPHAKALKDDPIWSGKDQEMLEVSTLDISEVLAKIER